MKSRIVSRILHFGLAVLFLVSTITGMAQALPGVENLKELDSEHLLNAMEIFMKMAPNEREETIKGLMASVGDDPAAKAEMEALIQMLPNLDAETNLQQLIEEDEIAKAKREASRQFSQRTWEEVWADQEEILNEVLASGQLRPEDAAVFKTDPEAWKRTLKLMYDDLSKPAGKDEL